MELRQLYYFTACAQAGSFSRAAAALYTTQSNVSKVIHNLERELGFELFERRQYGIMLTARGKQVYDYAQNTLGSADKILRYARSSQRSQLRILANPDLWISDVFCSYYRESGNRQTRYSFMTESTKRIIEQMEDGAADLGFIYITAQQYPSLADRLGRSHLVFARLRTMPGMLYGVQAEASSGRQVDLVQCGDEDFSILPSPENDDQAGADAIWYQVRVDTNDELVIRRLQETAGLGRVSGSFSAAPADAEEQPVMVNPSVRLLFGCLTRNDRNLEPQAISFLRYVREKIKETEDPAAEETVIPAGREV